MRISGVKSCIRLSFLSILATLSGHGYSQGIGDTIRIGEVIISRGSYSQGLPGFKKISVDSTLLRYNSLLPITETLDNSTQMFFKSYGAGATATTSFRGSGAARTEVSWNGVTLNDPMLGQTDFSLFPGGIAEGIQVSFGAASMMKGYGGIGGLIDLINKPVWKKKTTADINTGIGSFGTFSSLIKLQTGTDHFQSVTRFFSSSSRNDYPFLNSDALPVPEIQKRKNGSGSQKGFMQEFYLKSKNLTTSARVWYQSASRHLPGSTLYEVADSAEYQADESLRSQLSSEYSKGTNSFFMSGTWLYSKLNYFFPKYFIESRNRSNSLVFKAGYTRKLDNGNSLFVTFDNETSAVKSVNYSGNKSRSVSSVSLSAEHKLLKRFGALLLMREILDNGRLLAPDFSGGIEYRIIKEGDHFVKANISRNSSIPTMNDRYWNPGGNAGLRNEHTFSMELGYCFDQKITENIKLNSEITLFRNYIRDMIQWHPGDSYFWIADNIGSVNSSGFESSLILKCDIGNLKLNLNTGYSYTRAGEVNSSTPENNRKQLVYVPKDKASGVLLMSFRNIHFSWITSYTGPVSTSADNTMNIKGYTLHGVKAGYLFTPGQANIDFNFGIDNLFDISHQAIDHYPLPGRSYNLSLFFRFSGR
jgi:vitamin B12 transporter